MEGNGYELFQVTDLEVIWRELILKGKGKVTPALKY
jgi:hypothetical protein